MNLDCQISLDDGANVTFHERSQSEQSGHLVVQRIRTMQKAHSSFDYFNMVQHGLLNRLDLEVDLNEQGAEAKMSGIFLTKDKMHSDHHILVNHHASHTSSDVCVKGVATDKSTAVFNAKAYVAKGIEKISALQSNKNLLLVNTAQINTKPELEIYSDDVICSHGATVGQLDEKEIFYCQSRGIPRAEAVALLTEGFLVEVLSRLQLTDEAREALTVELQEGVRRL